MARLLLHTAEIFWREQSVRRVRAFSFSTGYPAYQLGVGILPSTWEGSAPLAESGRLPARWSVSTVLPIPCNGWHAENPAGVYTLPKFDEIGLRYQLYEGDQMHIAATRMIERQVSEPQNDNPVAGLVELIVASGWRNRGIGRWLLPADDRRRYLRGNRSLVGFVGHTNEAGLGLCRKVGFEEMAYRGYTLEKKL